MARNSITMQALAQRQALIDSLQSQQVSTGLITFTVPLPTTPEGLASYGDRMKYALQEQRREQENSPSFYRNAMDDNEFNQKLEQAVQAASTSSQGSTAGVIHSHAWKLKSYVKQSCGSLLRNDFGDTLDFNARIMAKSYGSQSQVLFEAAAGKLKSAYENMDQGSLAEIAELHKALQELKSIVDGIRQNGDSNFNSVLSKYYGFGNDGSRTKALDDLCQQEERVLINMARAEYGQDFKSVEEVYDAIAAQDYKEDLEDTKELQESMDSAAKAEQAAMQNSQIHLDDPNVTPSDAMEAFIDKLKDDGVEHTRSEGGVLKIGNIDVQQTADGISLQMKSWDDIPQLVEIAKAYQDANPSSYPILAGPADMNQVNLVNEYANKDMAPANTNFNEYEKLFKNEDGSDKTLSLSDKDGNKMDMTFQQFKQKVENARGLQNERKLEHEQQKSAQAGPSGP